MLICGAMKGCDMLGSRAFLRNLLRSTPAPQTAAAATSNSPMPRMGLAINQATPMTVNERANEIKQFMQHKAHPTISPIISPQQGTICGISAMGPVTSWRPNHIKMKPTKRKAMTIAPFSLCFSLIMSDLDKPPIEAQSTKDMVPGNWVSQGLI